MEQGPRTVIAHRRSSSSSAHATEARDKKPGNRCKRDTQLILMNFFSRVTYNDRMSPLDYDIFRKVQTLMASRPTSLRWS